MGGQVEQDERRNVFLHGFFAQWSELDQAKASNQELIQVLPHG